MTRPGLIATAALALTALLGTLLAPRTPPPPAPRAAPPAARPPAGSVERTEPAPTTTSRPEPNRPRDRSCGASSPRALTVAYAGRSITWTARDLSALYRDLGRLATGPLLSQLRSGAAGAVATTDPSGRSRGSVEAVRVRGAGTERELLVVTRETSSDGRQTDGPRYHTYLAHTHKSPAGRWTMTAWHPQP